MAYQEIPNSVANFMQEITERCGSEHADWAKTSMLLLLTHC